MIVTISSVKSATILEVIESREDPTTVDLLSRMLSNCLLNIHACAHRVGLPSTV